MKKVFVEQNTPEWHALRRTKIGASMSSAILGKHPFKTKKDVYEEMVLGKVPYVNEAMKRGTDLEPVARDWYNRTTFGAFLPSVIVNDEYPFMLASLDGIDEHLSSILEIKVPGEKTYNDCLKNKFPKYWEYQIQHQLLLADMEEAILLVWRNDIENIVKTFRRNPNLMEEIVDGCRKFYYENLLQFKVPDFDKKSYECTEDQELNDLLRQYEEAVFSRKEYEEVEETLKTNIILKCKGESKRTHSAIIERIEVKGRVEYDNIPEIKELDLEPYRKPATIRWKIRKVKDEA